MKKLIATIAALAMMAIGLVAGLGSAATAGDYTNTVPTNTKVDTPNIKKGKRVKTTVNVTSASDQPETGKVTITWKKKSGGFSSTKTFSYSGKQTYTGPRLKKPGGYTSKVTFKPAADSIFKKSSGSDGFKVRK